MFLAVLKKKVIDVAFQAEVIEDLNATPPVLGVAEVPEESHDEVDLTYIEDSAAQVAKNLDAGVPIDYYEISHAPVSLQTTLKPVTVKAGARAPGKTTEIVEIEAGGDVVGSAEVDSA